VPLAAQLSQQFTWLIVGGALSEGDELPPVQALADELGINVHTVRAGYQQLETTGLVSLGRGRRARVLAFDRTMQRRSGSDVPSHTIGVIVPSFVQFYAPLLSAIEAAAADLPASVFVANAHEDPLLGTVHLDRLIMRGVDGIVVAAAGLIDDIVVSETQWPPIVFIDAPGSSGVSIEYDLAESQFLATQHLIEHGHRRIGFVTAPLHLSNVAPKLDGHTRALQEAGIEMDPGLIVETKDFEVSSGRRAAQQLLTPPAPPTAITASSDALAGGVYQAAHALGIQIPDAIAITGNDGSDMARILSPPLTTVTLPIRQAGTLAVESLRKMRNGQPVAQRVVLDAALVTRTSCGCATT
jgi:DNA-binding LacI/PurR family transcriptional regulator